MKIVFLEYALKKNIQRTIKLYDPEGRIRENAKHVGTRNALPFLLLLYFFSLIVD